MALRKQITNAALAKRFGVSEALISGIAKGQDFRLKNKLAKAGFPDTSSGDQCSK